VHLTRWRKCKRPKQRSNYSFSI